MKTAEEWLKDWESGMRVSNIRLDKLSMIQAYHQHAMEQKIDFLKSQLKYPGHDDFGRGQYDGIQKAIEILKK